MPHPGSRGRGKSAAARGRARGQARAQRARSAGSQFARNMRQAGVNQAMTQTHAPKRPPTRVSGSSNAKLNAALGNAGVTASNAIPTVAQKKKAGRKSGVANKQLGF